MHRDMQNFSALINLVPINFKNLSIIDTLRRSAATDNEISQNFNKS